MPRKANIPKKGLAKSIPVKVDTHEGMGGINRKKSGLSRTAAKCHIRMVGPAEGTEILKGFGWEHRTRYDVVLGLDGYTLTLIKSLHGQHSMQVRSDGRFDFTLSKSIYMLQEGVDRTLYVYVDASLKVSRPDILKDARTGRPVPTFDRMKKLGNKAVNNDDDDN